MERQSRAHTNMEHTQNRAQKIDSCKNTPNLHKSATEHKKTIVPLFSTINWRVGKWQDE